MWLAQASQYLLYIKPLIGVVVVLALVQGIVVLITRTGTRRAVEKRIHRYLPRESARVLMKARSDTAVAKERLKDERERKEALEREIKGLRARIRQVAMDQERALDKLRTLALLIATDEERALAGLRAGAEEE
jgi:uncharacterized protein YlxW (UPF0749 family)